jgi:hypothetical protein
MAVKIKFLRSATDGSNRKNEFIKDHMFYIFFESCCKSQNFLGRVDRKLREFEFDKPEERDFGLGGTTILKWIIE